MTIQSGVYVLKNVASGSALGVDDGEWNDAKVSCWPVKEVNNKLNDLVYVRFLLYPSRSHKGGYNILNLRAGAFLVHHDKANTVRSKATNCQSRESTWFPEQVKPNVFTFANFDGKEFMGVKDSDKTSDVVLKPGAKKEENQWKLERTDMDKKKIADWMSMVQDQSMPFTAMNIVGTHQTMALNKAEFAGFHTDNPRCQNHGAYLQLCNGMRFFDLRLNYHEYDGETKEAEKGLVARHGINDAAFAWEGYSFSAIIVSLAYFLETHPGETVFVRARLEGTVPEPMTEKQFCQILQNEVTPYEDVLHQTPQGTSIGDISLNDVRGKALLTCGLWRGGFEKQKHGQPTPSPWNYYPDFWEAPKHIKVEAMEGPPKPLTVDQFDDHHLVMDKFVEKCAKDDNPKTFYWLGCNSSGKPAVHGMPMNEFYNPHDFFMALKKGWMNKHMDEKKHPKGSRQFGLITFDFFDECQDFINFVVERNKGVNV